MEGGAAAARRIAGRLQARRRAAAVLPDRAEGRGTADPAYSRRASSRHSKRPRRRPPEAMNPDLAWAVWSGERQRRVEDVLERVLPARTSIRSCSARAMRYAVLDGGKRMRPLLAYAAGELTDANPDAVDAAAAAVELIHAYSLIHDDLPCMDDDTLRRGKPTCHVAFGEAMALLAGDALQALAFGVLAGGGHPDPGRACALLADAAGVHGMAGGQAIDLDSVGATLAINELETMHRMKTGALIRGAVRLGAACGRPLTDAQAQALDRLRRRGRPRVSGRRRRARRRRLGGVARQDRGQGCRCKASRRSCRRWGSAPPSSARRRCAIEARGGARAVRPRGAAPRGTRRLDRAAATD